MMDNIYVKTDPAGNIKPDKEKSTERIDGAVALIMALDRALRHDGDERNGSIYLAAAKRLGISKGVGGNMFAPEKPLTRQEMCVLLYNLLNMLDKLPEQGGVSDASSFPDSNEVYDWASEAVSRFVSAGVITGSGGKLLPGGTTTRAQMAQVLYRLLSK
jgi:hypothetical protein